MMRFILVILSRLKLFDMLRCFIMVWSLKAHKENLFIINTGWFLDE